MTTYQPLPDESLEAFMISVRDRVKHLILFTRQTTDFSLVYRSCVKVQDRYYTHNYALRDDGDPEASYAILHLLVAVDHTLIRHSQCPEQWLNRWHNMIQNHFLLKDGKNYHEYHYAGKLDALRIARDEKLKALEEECHSQFAKDWKALQEEYRAGRIGEMRKPPCYHGNN